MANRIGDRVGRGPGGMLTLPEAGSGNCTGYLPHLSDRNGNVRSGIDRPPERMAIRWWI